MSPFLSTTASYFAQPPRQQCGSKEELRGFTGKRRAAEGSQRQFKGSTAILIGDYYHIISTATKEKYTYVRGLWLLQQ
jgi:hypothetical protein